MKESNKVELQYQEINLDDVLRYFGKGFEPPEGRRILNIEFFLDVRKGVVIFKIYTAVAESEVTLPYVLHGRSVLFHQKEADKGR